MRNDDIGLAYFAANIGVAVVAIIIGLGIQAAICFLLQSCFQRIPETYRKMQPGMTWLLMIPCFNIVWNFFVYPRLAQSFKACFAAAGRTDVGDCGEMLGWIFSGCIVAACIPFVNCVAAPAALVILIIYLVKANGLKNQLPATA